MVQKQREVKSSVLRGCYKTGARRGVFCYLSVLAEYLPRCQAQITIQCQQRRRVEWK